MRTTACRGWRLGLVALLTLLWAGPLTLGGDETTTRPASSATVSHTLWLEAESFAPLKGSNFSFQPVEQTTKGSWSLSGPGVAAEWTQGGESGFMSVAARADEPGELVISRETEAPAAGTYALWARYADYLGKKESFGVRIRQGDKIFTHVFGERAVVDELDQMKLLWGWAFGWDRVEVKLQKGPAHIELYTTGPAEARRQIDCICLTTDTGYRPFGREKPDSATWKLMRELRHRQGLDSAPAANESVAKQPAAESWKICKGPPTFLWNTGQPWLDELKKPAGRVEWPFNCDPSLAKDFVAAFSGKEIDVFGSPASGPAIHIPLYPAAFAAGSPFLEWLDKHPDRKFAILLNYGEPAWAKDQKHDAVYASLQKVPDRFIGYVAGENISYDSVDQPALDARIRAATTRGEILAAMRDAHTTATVKKFSDIAGVPLTAAQAWASDIPCLSAGMEAYAHALCAWGVRRIGHEGTGNSPTLARRLAFLRGAARQFGAQVVDYQSCNLGDASTIFNRESLFYPASSRYILDNQYDAWAGCGVNWVLKDYLLFHLAGADAFYHEEGNDIFWKPGGNSAGDGFPIELSPRGRVTRAVIDLSRSHPRGTQFTPVAFLLDEAHGYSQETFQPGAFGLDPQLNPKLLTHGTHFDSIRGWFDIAYFPTPQMQNEPATAIRQTYVNGIFGDIFDVIVTAPGRGGIASSYPVLIAAGELNLSEEWGATLAKYVEQGGTLVICADQLSGAGVTALKLPEASGLDEGDSFVWRDDAQPTPASVFRYHALESGGAQVLARTGDGKAICVSLARGKGRLIVVGVPMGLGIDQRPMPVLALLMQHITEPLIPLRVVGDVEWTLNQLDDRSWLVGLLNNSGINKPQHGVNPTDLRESREVSIAIPFAMSGADEWMTQTTLGAQRDAGRESTLKLSVPAGAVRLVNIRAAH